MLRKPYLVVLVVCDGALAEYNPTKVEVESVILSAPTLNDAWDAAAKLLSHRQGAAALIHDRQSEFGEGSLLIRFHRYDATLRWDVSAPANPPRLWEQVEDLADELDKSPAKRKDK